MQLPSSCLHFGPTQTQNLTQSGSGSGRLGRPRKPDPQMLKLASGTWNVTLLVGRSLRLCGMLRPSELDSLITQAEVTEAVTECTEAVHSQVQNGGDEDQLFQV
ncbi:hypothetical protein ILYODFUR_031787 [Ilyodon furcidens]|uniref:Uncharacterized protein n=1 Tax=Ilyodon furcidens TaxID=33524 RepID=A0ABV0V8Q6_9TELE